MMTVTPSEVLVAPGRSGVLRQTLFIAKTYFTLTKPKIMTLLLFTAYCGSVVAKGSIPHLGPTLLMLVGLAFSTGGAAAVNMWFDQDIDKVMSRTKNRPIPAGHVKPMNALIFGIALGVASVVLLAVWVNWLSAVLSFVGFVYYAVFYTMWLKRRTPHNTVIGGGAGAIPPLIGWAAVTGHLSLAAVLMFAIIFLWTPPHFWALEILKNRDYSEAGIPMMTVVKGTESTKRQSLWYSALLLLASLSLYFAGDLNVSYLVVAFVLGSAFLLATLRMRLEPKGQFVWARRTFVASLMYLPLLFIAMVIGVIH